MASSIENKIFEIADKVADSLNFSVVDAEFKKEGKDRILRIYIDSEVGAGLDECEKFSRAFDEAFDKLDIIKEAYILEVSSPGVDRVLKTEREFKHYIGRKVEVKLYKAIEGLKEFDGILTGYEDNTATVTAEDKEIKIPVAQAVYIKLYFRM